MPKIRFIYDVRGRGGDNAALDAGDRLSSRLQEEIRRALRFIEASRRFFARTRIPIDLLSGLSVLPGAISGRRLGQANIRLQRALVEGFAASDTGENLTQIAALESLFDQHGERLSALILNVSWARSIVGKGAVTARALVTAIVQLQGPDFALEQLPPHASSAPPLSASSDALQDWLEYYDHFTRHAKGQQAKYEPELAAISELWDRWRQRVAAYLIGGIDSPYGIETSELLLMAADASPGRFFRRRLADMTMSQWSRLILCAIEPADDLSVPSWTVSAGLLALGASEEQYRAFHETVSKGLSATSFDDEPWNQGLKRRDGSISILAIVNNSSAAQRWRVDHNAFGLIVTMRQYEALVTVLDRLARNGQFGVVAIEDGLGLSRLPLTEPLRSLRRVRFSANRRKVEHAMPNEEVIIGAESFGVLVEELALRAPRTRTKG